MSKNKEINEILMKLKESDFRNRFHLSEKDKAYVREKGMETIKEHAYNFILTRVAPKNISDDGKQTPMRGHPVFVAQHATACCCRGCLSKWHNMPKNVKLNLEQVDYIVDVIMTWIWREVGE